MLDNIRKGEYWWKQNKGDKDYMGSFCMKELSRNMFTRGPVVELWSFGIYGRFRCQGYGQQMLKEAIELAGDRKLMLYVRKDNEIAIHVYQKAGFEITGELGNAAWAMTYSGNEAGKAAIEAVLCFA